MIVDSSATTGVPFRKASNTSEDKRSILGCRKADNRADRIAAGIERDIMSKLASLPAEAAHAMVFTDQVFVGHLGTNEMAAAALGCTIANFLSFFLFGTATALDTLGSQAHGMAKAGVGHFYNIFDYLELHILRGTHTHLTHLTDLPYTLTLLQVGLALGSPIARVLLGQGPDIARLVGHFCWGLIPGIVPLVLMKYLQVQNVMVAPALVAAATFLINIASNAVFIDTMGFKGAPLATSFSRLVQLLALLLLVWLFESTRGKRKGWAALLFKVTAEPG
ncbi:hypothetical protein QJQ45_017041 [Haematococcus lacustris]|nr:hypothetical protein QJQ45_017041 [Haematococcus lacustris]